MSTFIPKTITATIGSYIGKTLYAEDDGIGLETRFQFYDVVLNSVSTQLHSDQSTREASLYNGLDLEAGMFISDDSADTIVKIVSISAKTETSMTCVVEDVDMLSYRIAGKNTISESGNVVIFELNGEGEPLLIDTSGFLSGKVDSLQSRFNLNERDDRVKFSHDSAINVSVGDIVTVDTNGTIVKFGSVGASATKLGTALELLRNDKDVYIKPFNDIIRTYSDPESLTANPGETYYTSETIAGKITTATGGKATFLHLNNKIATNLEITSVALPGASDILEINGVKVFDGPAGNTVADNDALSTLLNTFTSQTHITSAVTQAPAVVDSDDNVVLYPSTWGLHDVFIPIGAAGSTPGSYAAITISDGINTGTVTFNTPDVVVNLGADYDIMSPAAIVAAINVVITAESLDIICETYSKLTGNGDGIKLTTTGSATGITLTNVTADAFGGAAVGGNSSTGLNLAASLGAANLVLTRASGGPILVDGSPNSSGYINQGGVVSSNSGKVPYLLLIESEGGGAGVSAVGVDSRADINETSLVTTADNDTTGITITYTPFLDGNVTVKVNGIEVDLGSKLDHCYFSNDGGATARAVADIEAGDTLYWNGSLAGYELDATDDIDVAYQMSSLDV